MFGLDVIQHMNGEPLQGCFSYSDFCECTEREKIHSSDFFGIRVLQSILGMLEEIAPYTKTTARFPSPHEIKGEEREVHAYSVALATFRQNDKTRFEGIMKCYFPRGESAGELEVLAELLRSSEVASELFRMSLIIGVRDKYTPLPLQPKEFSRPSYWLTRLVVD